MSENKNLKQKLYPVQDNYEAFSEEDEIDLIELWNIIWSGKLLIILVTAVGLVVSVFFAMDQQKEYKTESTFISVGSGAGRMLPSQLGGFAALVGMNSSGGGADNHLVILNSLFFAKNIVSKLDLLPIFFGDDYDPLKKQMKIKPISWRRKKLNLLREWYKEKKNLFFDSTEDFSKQTHHLLTIPDYKSYEYIVQKAVQTLADSVSVSAEGGVYKIEVTGSNPTLISAIANQYITELENYLVKESRSKEKESLKFIEAQLQKAKVALESAEQKIQAFSERYGIFSVSDEAMIISQTIAALKAQIVLEEVNLQVLLKTQGNQNSAVTFSKEKLSALNYQLTKNEHGIDSVKNSNRLIKRDVKQNNIEISVRQLPALSVSYGRLMRELTVQQEIYKMLRTNLETTKIEANREEKSIQIIDLSFPPESPYKPNRKLIVLVGVFASFTMAVFFLFLVHFIRKVRSST
ncbi:MAG: hypothetical protein HQ517_17620 [SAR324 cluster bacterium]|nr:hypothetical protein [SAR324 cluster bacterium]